MSRKNTFDADDLVENPGSIIEVLLRDEILVERDLLIDDVTGDVVTIDGSVNNTPVNSSIDDFYNGAYIVNVTKNERYSVSDYAGSTNEFTMSSTPSWDAGDKCYIKNIRGDDFIDADTFDSIITGTIESGTTSSASAYKLIETGQNFLSTVLPGMVVKNTTDTTYSYVKTVDSDTQLTLMDDIMASSEDYSIYGTRSGWKFRRALTNKINSQDLLRALCYESNTMLFKSYNKYRLIGLENGYTVGTLDTPQVINGQIQIFSKLTSLQNIYTDFTLNYGYDEAKKAYLKRHFVNRNATSDSSLDDYKTNCASAETDYKIKNKWEYNSDWINDDNTAIYFLSAMVQKLTYQRMIVQYYGDIYNHFKYEIGDRVLINSSKMLPVGKNNTTIFLITGKVFDFKKKVVQFILLY